jgi:hypothetical protein
VYCYQYYTNSGVPLPTPMPLGMASLAALPPHPPTLRQLSFNLERVPDPSATPPPSPLPSPTLGAAAADTAGGGAAASGDTAGGAAAGAEYPHAAAANAPSAGSLATVAALPAAPTPPPPPPPPPAPVHVRLTQGWPKLLGRDDLNPGALSLSRQHVVMAYTGGAVLQVESSCQCLSIAYPKRLVSTLRR